MVAAAIKLAATPLSLLHLAWIASGQQLWVQSTTDIPTSFATLNSNPTNRKRESCNINSDLPVAIWLLAIVVVYRFDLAVKRRTATRDAFPFLSD